MLESFIIFLFGLVIGSFIAALTYRVTHNESISKGRSHCPKCKKQIAWFDNIPLFSYLYLNSRCRHCKKKISLRYPAIELSHGIVFVLIYLNYTEILVQLSYLSTLPFWASLLFLFFISALLIGIFVTDIEHQFIPDSFSFSIFAAVMLVLIVTNSLLLTYFISAFLFSSFLLTLHLITFGKGMGLGDVKLAVALGALFGIHLSALWMFLSFVTGSVVGIVFLATGKGKLGQKIPFGPYLVLSAFIVLLHGEFLFSLIFPYL